MLNPEKIDEVVNASTEDKLELLRKIAEIPSWDADYTSLYRELLSDPSPEVRKLCLAAFWDNGGDEDLGGILEVARNDPDTSVRAQACSTLGIFVYEGAMGEEPDADEYEALRGFLVGRLRDEAEDIDVRRYSLESLGFDDEDEIADMLKWAYEHQDPRWKASAVFAMGRAGGLRWTIHIVDALDSENRMVKLAAVKAASEGYCEEATPKLRNLALCDDRDIRLEAIWALGRTGGPGALETLEMCARDADEDAREMAQGSIEEYEILANIHEDDEDWDEDSEYDGFPGEWGAEDPFGDEEPSDGDWPDPPDFDRL